MKERPILFSAPMVRAILSGDKTQTRLAVKIPKRGAFAMRGDDEGWWPYESDDGHSVLCNDGHERPMPCPCGVPGDRLWVRETFHVCPHCDRVIAYRAGGWYEPPSGAPDDGGDRNDDDARPLSPKCAAHGWKPSIHMPRWASRITLEVVGVRVERLQTISEADARAEGISRVGGNMLRWQRFPNFVDEANPCTRAVDSYSTLWESINGAGSWADNPWVFVISVRRLKP